MEATNQINEYPHASSTRKGWTAIPAETSVGGFLFGSKIMGTKPICKVCNESSEITPSRLKLGDLTCRDCRRKWNKAWRDRTRVVRRRKAREKSQRPEEKVKNNARMRRLRAHPVHGVKDKVRTKTRWAITSGKITKTPCAVCETEKDVQVHHLSYDTHDNVIFLCRSHHQEAHGIEQFRTADITVGKE